MAWSGVENDSMPLERIFKLCPASRLDKGQQKISFICFMLIGILLNNYMIISTMIFNLLIGIFLIIKIFNHRKINLNIMLEKTSQFTFLNALLFSVSIWISVLANWSI